MPGPSVFPSGEPGVSGDFWGSQEGCQGPLRPLGRNRGLPLSPLPTLDLWAQGVSPSGRQHGQGLRARRATSAFTCHVPRPKAVTGMSSRNQRRKDSSSVFVAVASAEELPHLPGLQASPRKCHSTGMGPEALERRTGAASSSKLP